MDKLGIPEEELLRQQQELFAEAKQQQMEVCLWACTSGPHPLSSTQGIEYLCTHTLSGPHPLSSTQGIEYLCTHTLSGTHPLSGTHTQCSLLLFTE